MLPATVDINNLDSSKLNHQWRKQVVGHITFTSFNMNMTLITLGYRVTTGYLNDRELLIVKKRYYPNYKKLRKHWVKKFYVKRIFFKDHWLGNV